MTSSSGPALTPVDLPGEGPLVLVMDVDSTLILDEVIELIAGRLTGKVLGEVVDRAAKADFITRLAAASGVDMDRTVAVGDGANDLDMMAAAQVGIAFCAKPTVREQADVAIDEPDLRQVLDLLGVTPVPQPDDEGGYPLA